jgi:hypothetical protein
MSVPERMRSSDQKYDPEPSPLPHAAIARLASLNGESYDVRQL